MKKTISQLTLILFLGYCLNLSAQPNQHFFGTRPMALGETFVAIADDGNTIYWNPAGLAQMEHIEANFSYANLYGMGIKSLNASFLTRPYFIPFLTDYITLGFNRLGINLPDDDGLEFSNTEYNFAIGLRAPKSIPTLLQKLFIGAGLKYVKMRAGLDGTTEVDAAGFGMNVGILYTLDKWKEKYGKIKIGP